MVRLFVSNRNRSVIAEIIILTFHATLLIPTHPYHCSSTGDVIVRHMTYSGAIISMIKMSPSKGEECSMPATSTRTRADCTPLSL